MDCNFEAREFCLKECIFNEEFDLQADNEFRLADYYSPIKRVLNLKIEPAVTNKNITGNMVNIEGIVGVKLIYLSDTDELCCYESSFIFTKNIECSEELSGTKIKAFVSAEKVNVKISGERKFEIYGPLTLSVRIIRLKKQKFISPEKLKNCELKCENMKMNERVVFGEKNIIIDEEIELAESYPEVERIINYEGSVLPDECKIMNGKVMLKGALSVKITYLSKEGLKACHVEQKLPYSQVCDLDGIDDKYICNTEEMLVFLEVKSRNGGYEEGRTLTVNAKICVSAEAQLSKDECIICDMYSTEKEIELVSEDICEAALVEKTKETFTAKKSLKFSEGSVGSVISLSASHCQNGVKVGDGSASIYGTVYVKILLCDTSSQPQYAERAIDFEYKYSSDNITDNSEVKAELQLSDLSYIIVDDCTIEVSCLLALTLSIYNKISRRIVTGAIVSDLYKKSDDSAIYVCFNECESDLWSLAKKFKSSVSEITAINKLENDKVKGVIVIPSK